MSKIDKFKFSEDFVGKNAGDFKSRLEARYGGNAKVKVEGDSLTSIEIQQLVDREFKEDPGAKKLSEDGNSTPAKGKTEATTK